MQEILSGYNLYHIRHARDEHPDPDAFPMHAHSHYEILYFLSGDITYLVEGNSYHPTSRDIMIFNIAETHKVIVNSDTPYERIVVQADKALTESIDPDGKLFSAFSERRIGMGNLLRPSDFPDDFWEGCLMRLSRSDGNKLTVISNLLPLLSEISSASKKSTPSEPNETISSRLVGYINAHITEPFKPVELARTFLISRTALYSIFKNATGSSIHSYIQAKRLLMAKGLLSSGEKPTEVCTKCGFSDYTTFFRAYKRKFGSSPKSDKFKK